MTEATTQDVESIQGAVQRLLGQCLLRLQAYERLMKAIATQHEVSGSAKSLSENLAEREAVIARKTLGQLVGQLLGSFLTRDDQLKPINDSSEPSKGAASIAFSMQIAYPADAFLRIERELSEFVQLRNDLVHHFAERHDLTNFAGCQIAEQALIEAAKRIERHHADLRSWGEDLNNSRIMMAEAIKSPELRDAMSRNDCGELHLKL